MNNSTLTVCLLFPGACAEGAGDQLDGLCFPGAHKSSAAVHALQAGRDSPACSQTMRRTRRRLVVLKLLQGVCQGLSLLKNRT